MLEIVEHLPEINLNVNNFGTYVSRYNDKKGKFYEYKIQTTKAGYKQIQAVVDGERKTFMVHRLVAWAFVQRKGTETEVNHIDANKANNHASNLEWVTKKENMDHAKALKRFPGRGQWKEKKYGKFADETTPTNS